MASNYIYEPVIHSQVTASSIWTINHNFGRSVNIKLYDNSNVEMSAYVWESNLETAVAEFYEASSYIDVAGYAVVS